MAVKKKTEKQTTSWIGGVEKYSRQIWLAGLGAYSKVSKDGNKLFDTLVVDGEKAEKQAKTEVDKQVGSVKTTVGSKVDSAKSKVDEVKDKAMGKWGELEEAFDKRLNNAISRLGVPSRNEVKALNAKVESLTKQIEQLTGVTVKSVKPAVKKVAAKPAVKAAAKPAVKAAAKPAVAKPAAPAAAAPAPVAEPAAPATPAAQS
jgi:poly(hydroxyalkanoate) granule-associated protein